MRFIGLTVISTILASGCASRAHQGTVATEALSEVGEPRAVFVRGLAEMKAGRCQTAIASFDEVPNTFPESRYVSASLYNAGLCLQRQERWVESAERYERLLRERPDSPDVKHARFQLAFLYVETSRFDDALRVSRLLLEREDLTDSERCEAMARRAAALLGTRQLDAAESAAGEALRFYRTREPDARINDPFFAASASYTLAETIRMRSEAISIPLASVEEQRAVLERRAQLLLNAQRSYFDTIRLTDAYWASAAGYRIGAMYQGFWSAIMTAPVPPPKSAMTEAELEIYRREYRLRLAELAQPLVRHAIRYWELTLAMIQRTGVRSEWTDRIHADLERARERLLVLAHRTEESPQAEGGT